MTTDPVLTISVREAARITGLSTRTIYRAIASGDLNSYKVGRRLLITRDDLLSFIIEADAALTSR